MKTIHSAAPDLNLLKVFDAVMQARSVSRAAQLLGVGQSAVSHGLSRLREMTGDPLFIRTGGRMEPTARAQRLAEPMREALLLAVRSLTRHAVRPFDPASGRQAFTIGAGDYAATVLLGGLLEEIALQGWDIGIAVLPIDRHTGPAMLDEGRIDLALGLLPAPRRWHERVVLYEETHACVFDGERLGLRAPIAVEDFVRLPSLVPSLHGEFPTWVDDALRELGLHRRTIMASAHFLSIPILLKRVPAIATLPRRLCLACANASSLTVSPVPIGVRRFDISMLWHRRDSTAGSHHWLRERIIALNPRDPLQA